MPAPTADVQANPISRHNASPRRRAGGWSLLGVTALLLLGLTGVTKLMADAPSPQNARAQAETDTNQPSQPSPAPEPATEPAAQERPEPAIAAGESAEAAARPGPPHLSSKLADWPVLKGTPGYWRIGRDPSGVWWFVSPDNKPEFLNTVTTVQPYQLARRAWGPHFESSDWNGRIDNGTVVDEGNLDQWAQDTLERVRAAGFKGLGAWCHPAFHKLDVPITRDLNVWTYTYGPGRRLYHPDWAATVEAAIKQQVEKLKDNKNLVGYYSDNELDWGNKSVGPRVYFDGLAADDPNRVEVMKVIEQVWQTPEQFNKDWYTDIADWSEMDAWAALPTASPEALDRLYSAWLGHLAEDYFRITSTLIRKYDPNHLVMGVRFKGLAPREVVRASRNWTDAVSLNYYVSDAKFDESMFRMMYEESGQPTVITEYSLHALDGRSGNRNTFGFVAQVLDQQARADGYRIMTQRLAKVPWVIGADWFQWSDEPPSGRVIDGEDVNFGIVDVDDRPYQRLVESIRRTTPTLNALHAASPSLAATDVWREDYLENLPGEEIAYLSQPPRLNGELSDWPEANRLTGVRHGYTLGLERAPMPVPTVLVGWTYEGLYVGMEVHDHDIDGAPPTGWWWTRDTAEVWINTRPVDQHQHGYNAFSHQIFFIPDPLMTNGEPGTVGQWSRPGDALDGRHQIPHPQIIHATRIFQDRYVVEMFIPAVALNGYDPANHPEIAFNFHAHNFQNAISYFWSAPKEVMTQQRPNTWGSLHLVGGPPPPQPRPQVTAVPTDEVQ